MAIKNSNITNMTLQRNPGEVYVGKAKRGTFGEQTYGVYLQGDNTLTGDTVTLGLFFNKQLAIDFLRSIEGSETVEKIRRELFKHPEKDIPIDLKITITHEEWEEQHPELVKYTNPHE